MVSPMNAGLPNQPGVARYRVGDLRKMGAQTRLAFTDEEGQFIRLGNMLTWSGNYNGLVKNHKGFCIRDYPTISYGTATNCTGMNFYLVNGQYHGVGGASGQRFAKYGNSGDLSFANGLESAITTNGMTDLKCSALFASNVVAIGGVSGGSNAGLMSSSSNAAYATASGPGAVSFSLMASNGNNLGMAVIQNGQTSGTNNIWTTTTGSSWAGRVGSGGTSGVFIAAAYWSPCASAFLLPLSSVAAMNKTVDGYTQTSCTLPASVTAASFFSDGWKTKAAHSATASLIILTDGTLLRTTDGTAFSIVNPLASDPYTTASVGAWVISHDGARFILFVNGGSSGAPAFYYSEDDGLTWIASWAYECISDPVTAPQLIMSIQLAGSKLIMGASASASTDVRRIYDMTAQVGSTVTPTKVGSTKGSGDTPSTTLASAFNYLKVA